MFLGHKNDLNDREWIVLNQCKDWALVRSGEKYYLMSNVCPHQGSYLKGVNGKNMRVCPYHGWSFNIDGDPVGSGTTESRCKNTFNLETKEVFEWNGFLFSEPHDLELTFNTSKIILEEKRTIEVNCNHVHTMDLFLDVDHIPVVHPKVYDKINTPDVRKVEWILGANTATQIVPNTMNYDNEFTETLLDEDRENKYGAAWLSVYPHTMIEWQPGAWFITVVTPKDDTNSFIEVYKYRDSRYSLKNWSINSRVWEEAFKQDVEQSEKIKKNYFLENNLEVEKLHFRNWIKKNVWS